MTRKDYVIIAAVIASQRDQDPDTKIMLDCMAGLFADALARDNSRFNRTRFLEACGAED